MKKYKRKRVIRNYLFQKCDNCKKKVDMRKVKSKRTGEYEGITVHYFDCPYCGKEMCDL